MEQRWALLICVYIELQFFCFDNFPDMFNNFADDQFQPQFDDGYDDEPPPTEVDLTYAFLQTTADFPKVGFFLFIFFIFMTEKYVPTIQSGAYTEHWAGALGLAPEELNPAELISKNSEIQAIHEQIVRSLIAQNLANCGAKSRISPPTYPAARLVGDRISYDRLSGRMHEILEEEKAKHVATNQGHAVTAIHSVAFRPDGFVPEVDESITNLEAVLIPQFAAAMRHGAIPVVEATTTLHRAHAAVQAAERTGVENLEIGFAVDQNGDLAIDLTNFAKVLEAAEKWAKSFSTFKLNLHCGSEAGAQKVIRNFPGVIHAYYPNRDDGLTILEQDALGRPEISPAEIARLKAKARTVQTSAIAKTAVDAKVPVVSICCGFKNGAVGELRRELTKFTIEYNQVSECG